jgi:hypothetical protein
VPIGQMMKLIRWFTWNTFGFVGTPDAMSLAPRDLVVGAKHRSFHVTGPYKGKILFRINRKAGTIYASISVAETISGSIPRIFTSLPHTAMALALQSAYEVFQQGKGILAAFEELFVALDELNLGKSVLSKNTYCKCLTGPQQDNTAHYCMLCFKLEICSMMSRTADDRLVCTAHFKDGPPAIEDHIVRRLRYKVSNIERPHRVRHPLSSEERKNIMKILVRNHIVQGSTFLDAYGGSRSEEFIARWLGPLVHSVDAVFPV